MEKTNTSLTSRIPIPRHRGPQSLPLTVPRHTLSQPRSGTLSVQSDPAASCPRPGASSINKRSEEELHVSHVPRSRLSCPWLLETPTSGYTAPRRSVYAAIVSVGSEGGRPPGYYAQQTAFSTAPLGLPSHTRKYTVAGGPGSNTYLKNVNFSGQSLLEAFTSQPRWRRTVCEGRGFSLPSLPEEDGNAYRLRSSSVVMGTQAFSMNSQKVNNIEKAEKMKTRTMGISCDNVNREEVRHNIENSRKIKAIEDLQGCLKTRDGTGDKEAMPDIKSSGSSKRVSFSSGKQPESPTVVLPGARARLSYVEPEWYANKAVERLPYTKKRSSWAAGEILHKGLPTSVCQATVVLNNRRVSWGHRSRSSSSERLTLYPRTASCVNIPKCKKRLSWASSEKRRFSWAPGHVPTDTQDPEDHRRYSFAGEESRRSAIRMGTRSLGAPLTPPPPRCPRHPLRPVPPPVCGRPTHDLYTSHNRQETTLVHPITHKSAVQAEAIPPPPPAAAARCEATSATPVPSSLNNQEQRKAGGRRRGGSWVKTPGARRPEVAPVTHQGWLYKQGADGLHLWKKRWFVLSEYCLYYYKGPEEDKVLGSLPLPSFKISPVDSEDRVYRRHAFKAEHQNTRTYYFAAETREQMAHWMNALSLASILQKDTSIEEKCSSSSSARRSERPSVSSLASTASPSADESDSGFHGYRSRRYRSPDGRSLDEASESSRLHAVDRLNTSCDSAAILRPGDRQPLYANAPPKPKRLNSSRDYSTSPERSPERDDQTPRSYTDRGEGGSDAGCSGGIESRSVHYHPPTAERRTPDAYGVAAGGSRGDYEDVYGDSNESNSIPHSSVRRTDQRDSFASSRSGGTRLSEELQLSDPLRSKFCRQEDTLPRDSHYRHYPKGPPRPHSADFLEYDRRHGSSEMWSYRRGSGGELQRHNETRPKSSVGQAESDHWSEENYAQKMRQSSLYHSHIHSRSAMRYSPAGPAESPASDHHHMHSSLSSHSNGSQRVPPAGAATPDLYTPHKPTPTSVSTTNSWRRGAGQESTEIPKLDTTVDMKADLKPYPRHDPRQAPPRQETRHSHRPDPSLDHRTYSHEDAVPKLEVSPNTTLNSVPTPPGSYQSSASPNGSVNNNFMRSASARLPRQHLQEDLINTSLPDDNSDGDTRKIQQREESMKRLLEWKQRMLQSPLTRKPNARPDGTTTPQPRTNNEAYRQQVLNELANQEARTKVLQNHSHSQNYLASEETSPLPHPGSLAGQSFGYSGSMGVSPSQTPVQNNWAPGNHSANTGAVQFSGSNPGGLYLSPGVPSERPAPQGGSCPTGSDSGSSKKRDGRRETSRTRHVSGDARRSTSASRYNSYSSDEEDLLEERETRKRTRRNSRRSSTDLSRESRKLVMPADGCKSFVDDDRLQGSPGNFASEQSHANQYVPEETSFISTSKSSPDYVNINVVSESQEGRTSNMIRNTTGSVENKISERTVSQRAEPVFIENHEGYDEVKRFDQQSQDAQQHLSVSRTCEQSFVYSDQIYAARDPYYVSDVQLPAMNDKFEEDRSDISSSTGLKREYDSSYGAQNTVQGKYKINNDSFEISEYNGEKIFIDSKNFHHDTSPAREESLENSVGYASFDSHMSHKPDNVTLHASQKCTAQDDATSTGKYSDSGYDTLRAEMSLHRDERRNGRPGALWAPDTLESSPECSSVVRRRGFDPTGRRPETWSPEKFDRSWNTIDADLKSKVDESKVVKEYSYEYITPEKDNDTTSQDNFTNNNHTPKKSTSPLACLESPKMVQETQHQAQNLVQDRIKKFTSKASETKETFSNLYPGEHHMNLNRYGDSNKNNKMICINSEVPNFREPLKEPLKPLSPQIRSSEALVSPLKAEFATSESTVVTAQEAQVKNVSDYKRREEVLGPPFPEEGSLSNTRLTSGSEPSSMEYRELRSPQDIMDSRLSRTNIRKFLFDDDSRPEEPKVEPQTNPIKPPLMKKPIQTRSVKALLKNFEEKSIEHMERVNLSQDSSRKKFHSDSEMLSNESSSDEGQCEDLYSTAPEKNIISPTTSVLADLRKSADDKKDDMGPLVPPPRPPKKPTLGGEMDAVVTPVTPGYLRLSLTESIQESLKVQEDSESGADEPSWMDTMLNSEQSKLCSQLPSNGDSVVIDLDKPPEEEAPPPPPMYLPNGEAQSPVMRPNPYTEENYLPMSPPKKLSHGSSMLAPASSCSSLSSKHHPTPEPIYPDAFAKTEYEEHTYIEMSGDASSSGASILAPGGHPRFDFSRMALNEHMFPPESPRYYEISDKDECQHYEYIYKGQSHYEAIYMEVPNTEKESTVDNEKPEIPSKPDELKAQLNADRNYASDAGLNSSLNKLDLKSQSNASSDADDEASKDLESLDPPRNPRFSLSDTFRPASYYLSGAEPSSDPDAQDSSDSDLVPPPPIPMSPPPLDDLDTGGPKAKNFDFDNLETPDPPLHLRNALSSSRSLRVGQNNLRDDLNSSRSSIGKEKRIFEKSDSQSSLHVDKLKRRPVFEETLESLHDDDNFILRSEDRYPASAAYPEDCSLPAADKFQRDRRKPFPQCAEDVLLPGDKHEPSARPKSALDHNSSFQGNLDTSYSSNNIENPYVNEAFQQSLIQSSNSYQSVPDGREYCNVPPNAKVFSQPERERSSSTGSRPKSPDPYAERNELSTYQNVPAPKTSLSTTNSPLTTSISVEPTGSPMIDALRGVHSPVLHLQPSHQRTSSEASSRSVVSPTASVVSGGGGVAPIHLRATSNASVGSETSPRSAPYYYSDVIRDDTAAMADSIVGTPRSRSYQLNNQRDLEANKRQDIGRKVNQISSASDFEQRRERLAHELRTSMEFLEGKTVSSPDERNVYDSDTLRKMKRRAYTPDPELDAKNVFPHGLSIKTDSPPLGPPMGHRRTRSLEGLLDDPPRPFLGEPNNVQNPHEVNKTCGGGPSQGSNWANTAAFPSVHPAQIGVRGGAGASFNPGSNASPHAAVTPNRGAFSQLTSQRASVSSLHSSGSLPQRTTSPYAASPLPVSPVPPYQVGSRDSLVSRESSASRFSGYDPRVSQELRSPSNHETLHEEQDWEDDTQWREQLRRASLRHTRSLETLDDGRPRRGGDGASREARPPAKLSVPSNTCQVPPGSNQQRLQQLHWDEYTVDYREGRLCSNQYRNNGALHSETLERTRRGLTCLEGYEWDEAEEKFKKPGQPGRPQQPLPQAPPNSVQHQPFLVDGLPPSPGTEGEEQRHCQVSPAPPPAHAPPSPPPQLQHHFLAGGGEGSDASSGVGGRPPGDFQGREEPPAASPVVCPIPQDAASTQPVPDVIPPHDVKLGESLPRRLDNNPVTSSGPQPSSHTHTHPHPHPHAHHQNYQHHSHPHHQNYQHHPHPHSQNQYHHYKSDDLHKYHDYREQQNYQSNGPYSNCHGGHSYSHGYSENHVSYSSNYKHAQSQPHDYQEGHHQQALPTTVIADYNNTLSSQHSSSGRGTGTYRSGHYDFQDYHNYKNHQQDFKHHPQDYKDYRHADYGTYDKHMRHHDQRLNGRIHSDIHQQQFSDSELTVSKQQQYQQQHQQPALPVAPPGQDTVDVRGLQGLSAGELLGKTHEELVLLLIQLRRHHSALQSARHHSRVERDSQARLAQLDGDHREDHLRRLASLNHHLHDLDKQYEMGKPLINLVDNMVKLGSLYRGGDSRLAAQQDPGQSRYYQTNGFDSLQFSRRIQERRIVAEDLQLQEHELASADQSDLEGKVMQLYKLDKNLHQESLTIQSLQREKKLEETAAENSRLEHEMMMLRQKIQMTMARNCQREAVGTTETRHIQSEMVRVQTLLEDLQRRRIELSHQIQKLTSTNPGLEVRPSPTGVAGAAPVPARRRTHSTWLETDLDAMITRDRGLDPPEVNRLGSHPVYVNASGYVEEISPNEYSESPDYIDSDYPPPPPPPEHMHSYNYHLDRLTSFLEHYNSDQIYLHSQSSFEANQRQMLLNGDHDIRSMMTLDRDAADNKPDGEEQQQPTNHMDISDADDRMKRYYGILPKEKPLEIKTVRIVKRESTERRKDRTTGGKRVTIGDSSLTHLLEDDVESDGFSDVENEPPMPSFAARSASLPRNYGRNGPGEKASMMAAMMRTSVGNSGTMTRPSNLALRKSTNWKSKNENPKDRPLSAHEQLFGFSRETEPTPPASPSKSDPPSPVFKSAAAKEIIKEMASEAEKHRRTVPKEKRRHFTISSSRPLTLETRDTGAEEGARSRDDCDMVRALRPRNHPDVVKSTLSTRDLRFNESTIDNILGAPNKIYIPERYMPDEDDEKEPTEEERVHREQKAESIRKMLSETQTTVTTNETKEEKSPNGDVAASSSTLKAKVAAERKEREHLLALNQILARQVMEKSRVVAVRALTMLTKQPSSSDDDLSPMQPLPLVQQRENYLV
ncbi:uncharacterized protein LOC126995740 isoform X6 [Eriocheir sinensis]|uniref:uncharacterized protein LOC126995740 isoform X6 n=1 Tax=Eriocheir sinensis TaxID=95602 RepID=UPI0021C948BE|nr:uncharacterized protein LOC126995740 isoform X6 [Eriocheir sinensis]